MKHSNITKLAVIFYCCDLMNLTAKRCIKSITPPCFFCCKLQYSLLLAFFLFLIQIFIMGSSFFLMHSPPRWKIFSLNFLYHLQFIDMHCRYFLCSCSFETCRSYFYVICFCSFETCRSPSFFSVIQFKNLKVFWKLFSLKTWRSLENCSV